MTERLKSGVNLISGNNVMGVKRNYICVMLASVKCRVELHMAFLKHRKSDVLFENGFNMK